LKDFANTLMSVHPKTRIKRKALQTFGFVNLAKIQIEDMEFR
jgi:hypothetical protein